MVGVVGVLSVCEVQVFTAQEFAKEQCAPNVPLDRLSLYNRVCYELQLSEGANYLDARRYCQKFSGDLAHTMPDPAFQFLIGQLERKKDEIKTQRLWIGVHKASGSQNWEWVNGEPIEKPRWGKDQPNSYVGEQNCVVLDGSRDWLWNDFTCGINFLHWICEYRPQKCGSPDRKENTTIAGSDFAVNRTIQYRCPEGSRVVGDAVRTCAEDGRWSGQAPSCQHVDCGPLTGIEKGNLTMLDGRTTHGARARFICQEHHALLGEPVRTCGDDGQWSGAQPKCLYALCPKPEPPAGATMQLRGNLTAGTEALFTCAAGHRLIGSAAITCQLGGTWSAPTPLCRLIDCGQPPEPEHGTRQLHGGTLFGENAAFRCDPDYLLMGSESRTCQENGLWSGEETICQPIDCGEPEVPADSYVTGYDFHAGSEVEYHCNDGFLRIGEKTSVCRSDGSWSGQPPLCQFVDCGRTLAPLRGEVQYVTGETYLGSELEYSCSRSYQLVGERTRLCQEDGAWSGAAPTCVEIRCEPPDRPQNSVLSFSGNDGRRQKAKHILANLPYRETYRVTASVTYKCKPGYKVVGDATRSCRATGGWSGLPPSCVYVDCGAPDPLPSGT
ncbi:P-selectin-like, partial [Pollicipes pollicipes]|uniref:P-selectin-like n=1 Tax=Pollicipes pollicipes TaxID=41117 RepID=UPI0018859045